MLRDELEALVAGRLLPGGFVSLRRVASAVVRRTPRGQDNSAADDLVAEYLASLVTRAGRNGLREAIAALTVLEDPVLESHVRRRMSELAAETGPRWSLLKAVREHVGEAIPALPVPPPALPLSVVVGDRLSSSLIAEACAFWLAAPDPPLRDRRVLAAMVMDHYFSKAQLRQAKSDAAAARPDIRPDVVVRRHRDAYVIADRLVEELGPQLASTLMRRLAGAELREIAEEDGCAVATVHARIAAATELMKEIVQRTSSAGTLGLALQELARRASRSSKRRDPAEDA